MPVNKREIKKLCRKRCLGGKEERGQLSKTGKEKKPSLDLALTRRRHHGKGFAAG